MTDVAFWTAEEDATLARMIGKGASATQVAMKLGRSRNAVCGRIHRKNLQPKHNIKRAAVKRAARLVEQPKITRTRFSPDEDKVIRDMAAAGKSGSEIGAVLNRSISSVIKRARAIGTPLRGKCGPEKKVVIQRNAFSAVAIAAKREARQHGQEFKHVTPILDVEPLMVALVDLGPSHCKFPLGDPREESFGFCGLDRADGAYCNHHARLCYTPPEDRHRRRAA